MKEQFEKLNLQPDDILIIKHPPGELVTYEVEAQLDTWAEEHGFDNYVFFMPADWSLEKTTIGKMREYGWIPEQELQEKVEELRQEVYQAESLNLHDEGKEYFDQFEEMIDTVFGKGE